VEEAGEGLLTFFEFLARQHKSMRTTNADRAAAGQDPLDCPTRASGKLHE